MLGYCRLPLGRKPWRSTFRGTIARYACRKHVHTSATSVYRPALEGAIVNQLAAVKVCVMIRRRMFHQERCKVGKPCRLYKTKDTFIPCIKIVVSILYTEIARCVISFGLCRKQRSRVCSIVKWTSPRSQSNESFRIECVQGAARKAYFVVCRRERRLELEVPT